MVRKAMTRAQARRRLQEAAEKIMKVRGNRVVFGIGPGLPLSRPDLKRMHEIHDDILRLSRKF